MKTLHLLPLFLLLFSCGESESPAKEIKQQIIKDSELKSLSSVDEFIKSHPNSGESKSSGKVSKGKLENGYLVPFKGENFHYFDTTSFLLGRGFVNSKVYQTLVDSYGALNSTSKLNWCLMECSNQAGGKLMPHLTHQNGLSCDFMSPMLKNGNVTNEYDNLGADHYFLNFNSSGKLIDNEVYSINFDAIGEHILALNEAAKQNGLKIEKVIWKIELKDELFASKYGAQLKQSGIYFATSLSHMINELHDDHYHVDFKPVH